MFYRIVEKTVEEPLIDLPKGCKVVSMTHELELESTDPRFKFRTPEHWTVTYLEPVSAGKVVIERIKEVKNEL